MDERFRNKRPLIAAAVVAAVIFLCVTLCFMGALGSMFLRSSAQVVPPIQPPAIGEDVGQPQLYYGPWFGVRTGPGVLGHLAFGAVLVFGLLLVLSIGRFVMGPRRCGPYPAGKGWKGHHHPWGPWDWRDHGKERSEEESPADDEDLAYAEAE